MKKSIEKGVKYLKDTAVKKGGNWEDGIILPAAGLEGGPTALAVLALLNSGEKVDSPAVKGGLDYLRKLNPVKTYVVALQTMAMSEALLASRDKKDLPRIAKNVEWLEKNAIRRNGKLDGWSYPGNDVADNSNTQYALLGLYAAKVAGVKIDDQLWKEVQDYYTRTQKLDPANAKAGFWMYDNRSFPLAASFTMSVGGVRSAHRQHGFGQERAGAERRDRRRREVRRLRRQHRTREGHVLHRRPLQLRAGQVVLLQLLRHRAPRPPLRAAVHRQDGLVPRGVRQTREAPTAQRLVRVPGRRRGFDKGYPVVTTSFALLYLTKGRTPVLVSKFAWGRIVDRDLAKKEPLLVEPPPGRHHHRRAELEPQARRLPQHGRVRKREIFDNAPLSWQVYDMRLQDLSTPEKIDSEVGLLLQSPIVYLNGHGPMPFVTRATEKLSVPEQILKRLRRGGRVPTGRGVLRRQGVRGLVRGAAGPHLPR